MLTNSALSRDTLVLLMTAVFIANSVVAADYTAKDLGKTLTPLGAEQAGNPDKTIPPWEGGIAAPPAGFKPGDHHPDPYADDDILFTITADNASQYKDKLSPGQLAMLQQYTGFRMPVYATRRSASAPQRIYDATLANAESTKLVDDGNGISGAVVGTPFPIPQNGLHALWNHLLRYRGEAVSRRIGQAAVTAKGAYTMVMYEDEFLFAYNGKDVTPETLNNKIFYFKQNITAPARIAGRILLAHETINMVREPRAVWVYNPGQRRVRRAPEVVYDSPPPGTDGLRTVDQFDMFNGAPDRYDWQLVGKREMYVPYNSYKLHAKGIAYEDILKPGHINPEFTRYELHRVWVVDALLKKGMRHLYARRTFYIDEDSWQIMAIDQYDERGQIWRVSEAHCINYYEVPVFWSTVEVHYDLQSRRYLAFGLNNLEPMYDFSIQRNIGDYTPAALRRAGLR
ncbi:MAG: hypothetical protein AMJ53_15890 [Gammaproteobacteria bacterium SG8_11]|nr:MAG: hypothetical protein AMJ53_15890 [Gammaproteobacteria bacterium SG8_11]